MYGLRTMLAWRPSVYFFVKRKTPRNSNFYISSSLKQILSKLRILCNFFSITNSFLNLFSNLITYYKNVTVTANCAILWARHALSSCVTKQRTFTPHSPKARATFFTRFLPISHIFYHRSATICETVKGQSNLG